MDITLNNICKSYGGKQVLKDFSCIISVGSVCAVMAPSGAGKTTLLRLILGLEQPDSGTLSGIPERKSALFQEDRLCPNLSIRRNIRMAAGKAADTEAVLTGLGLSESGNLPASQLSGGMARRAALARALLYDGELLVLDEPFNGLDEETRIQAAQVIRTCRRGRTLLLVTHRKEDLALLEADQLITL